MWIMTTAYLSPVRVETTETRNASHHVEGVHLALDSELLYKLSECRKRSHKNTSVWCGHGAPVGHGYKIILSMNGNN